MAKRPPKPEDREAQPRYKAKGTKTVSGAIEASRRLTDLEAKPEDINIEKYFQLDDRSFAIMRGANVENALELTINRKIKVHNKSERRSLFRSDGPLGTFSNKITMGYALDIFGPITKENLSLIRHVRNVFAHAKQDVDFSTKEIVDLCAFMKLPPIASAKKQTEDDDAAMSAAKEIIMSHARKIYHITTFVTEISLIKFSMEFHKREMRMFGKDPGPDPDWRIIFDESLP